MFIELSADLLEWWESVPPGFAFLTVLPFALGALALGKSSQWFRRVKRSFGHSHS